MRGAMLPALALFQSIGPAEILIIVLILLLLFGSTKIPELARNLGKAKADFKRGEREGLREQEREREEEELRREARELGIPTEGRSLEELRREVAARRS